MDSGMQATKELLLADMKTAGVPQRIRRNVQYFMCDLTGTDILQPRWDIFACALMISDHEFRSSSWHCGPKSLNAYHDLLKEYGFVPGALEYQRGYILDGVWHVHPRQTRAFIADRLTEDYVSRIVDIKTDATQSLSLGGSFLGALFGSRVKYAPNVGGPRTPHGPSGPCPV